MSCKVILLVFHVSCAAVWFGGPLTVPGMVHRGLAGSTDARWMAGEVSRLLRRGLIFGGLTLATGLFLIFREDGLAAFSPQLPWGMLLGVVLLVWDFITRQFVWQPMNRILTGDGDRAPLNGLRKRLAMTSGIRQLLWLAVLALMVWE